MSSGGDDVDEGPSLDDQKRDLQKRIEGSSLLDEVTRSSFLNELFGTAPSATGEFGSQNDLFSGAGGVDFQDLLKRFNQFETSDKATQLKGFEESQKLIKDQPGFRQTILTRN